MGKMKIKNYIHKLHIFYIFEINVSHFIRITQHEKIQREHDEELKRKQQSPPPPTPSPNPGLSGMSHFHTPSGGLTL